MLFGFGNMDFNGIGVMEYWRGGMLVKQIENLVTSKSFDQGIAVWLAQGAIREWLAEWDLLRNESCNAISRAP